MKLTKIKKKTPNRVRLGGNGPYVQPKIAADYKKRKTSIGQGIEADWADAREMRAIRRNEA